MFTQKLPVTLTTEEMSALAEDLGKMEIELAAVREAKKLRNKELNAQIDNLQQKIDYKAGVATSGQEYRDVECDWIVDRLAGIKRLIRNDNEREVRNEKLTEEEMQGDLFSDSEEQSVKDMIDGVHYGAADPDIQAQTPESTDIAISDEESQPPELENGYGDASFINERNRNRKKKSSGDEAVH